MRIVALVTTLVPFASFSHAREPLQNVKPTSLMSWLQITECDGFQLLHATDNGSYYFAIYVDDDGDLLIAEYCHEPPDARTTTAITVRNPATGKDLHDMRSQKKSPKSNNVVYRNDLELLGAAVHSKTTVAYSSGTLYPITDHSLTNVRVIITSHYGEDAKTLLDHLQPLPKQRGTSRQ